MIRGLGSASRPFRETAAREIHTRYGERLAALAQQRLSTRMRRRLDAEDITQSVFKSLFLRVADGRLVVENREDLGALLISMTLNKLHRAVTHQVQQKRDLLREQALPHASVELAVDREWESLRTREPDPAFELVWRDEIEWWLAQLPNESLRELGCLKLAGLGNGEIAVQLDCSLRTVERKLILIRRIWEECHQRGTSSPD
ncbi:MAG: RNA polymerase sigma factor [Planctomycetaceae bacterium]